MNANPSWELQQGFGIASLFVYDPPGEEVLVGDELSLLGSV
jgi:hypothetical protein